MKKYMTTFEMAQAAYENPGKVFVGRGSEPHSEIEATYDRYVKNIRSGNSLDLQCHQADGYIWNEKVEPLRGSYEFEATANNDGQFGPLPYNFRDLIRRAAASNPKNYKAVANKRFKVTVNVEEIV